MIIDVVTCFSRFGPRHVIDTVEDFTRLAFDTITLCAMSYRYVSPRIRCD